MANALGNNGGRLYSFASQPVLIDCNFIVDATNGNGLGVRSVKGQGVQNVYMATSASFTGTTHTGTNVIDGISGGTASLVVGMPVATTDLPAGATITAISSTSAITVSVVATTGHAGATITYVGVGNPLVNTNVSAASSGLAWIHLRSNYNRYLGGFSGFVSPPNTGSSALKIDATDAALTVGSPYTIASVGVGPQGAATIAPVADSSGSLASKYFMLYDSYGNSFCIYIIVNGVGSPPNLGPALSPAQVSEGVRGLSYVPLVLATNASAATQTTALSTLINALPSGIQGQASFTTSGGGTSTLTVTSTLNAPLAGIPQDGSQVIASNNGVPVPIYFTISSGSATAGSVWTDGSGNLYTVSATLSSGTLLKTSGYQAPSPAAGTLTFVSGSGSTTALSYSAAVAGLATGFTFALTVNDTNLQDWQAVGVPAGVTPVPNVAFIAQVTGAGGSTGTVWPTSVSGITSIEVIGDPNQSLAPQPLGGSPHQGGWILVQFLATTVPVAAGTSGDAVTNNAGVLNSTGGQDLATLMVPTAPAANSVVGMSFYVDARQSPSNISSH